jgi:ParB family chromosome partitioning protein
MSETRRLGRGLEALLGPVSREQAEASGALRELPMASIKPNPYQPRTRMDEGPLDELVASIQSSGLLQPVLVRPRNGGYELIAGERRWRAARVAGLATVPALVRETDDRDSLLLALVENVAREDLSPVDEARAYAALMDEFGLSLGEVAEHVGRSKPTVSNRLRLLELPDDVLGLVERGQLSEGHARAVLAVPDNEERRRLVRRIVRQGLSVRAAERAARWAGARTKPRRTQPVDPALAERVRGSLRRLTGSDAKVAAGRIEVYFADDVELAEIAEALERVSLQSAGAGD